MAKVKDQTAEVKHDVQATSNQHPHFKNGHNWLIWITGLTSIWMLITFICTLNGDNVFAHGYKYLNTWYAVNLGAIVLIGLYATLALAKKCKSLVFWSSTLFFVMMLQAVSVVIVTFYQEDAATINALVMFVWAVAWYTYLVGTDNVEADYPAVYRSHTAVGTAVLGVMTLSTVAYGIFVCCNLLW
ncbi:MAG: hypothetical protein K2K84_03070 [Muribaculaceae bacterium]|nr:hypothetical protein [Muribaculaceae bacterium]